MSQLSPIRNEKPLNYISGFGSKSLLEYSKLNFFLQVTGYIRDQCENIESEVKRSLRITEIVMEKELAIIEVSMHWVLRVQQML